MQIYITSFNNVRYFDENTIPISTAASYGWPWWLYKSDNQERGTFYINSNNVMIGIKEELLVFPEEHFEHLTEPCQKDCPFIVKAPHCQFMDAYYNYLSTLDFKHILSLFEQTAEEVRKATHFRGEPIIVLLVYEAASKVCGERYGLRKWFEDNDCELPEWQKEDVENIF